MSFDPDDYLAKLVFGGLPLERFEKKFEDEIGELNLETCTETHTVSLPRYGKSLVRALRGGLTVVCDQREHWHVYKNRARVEHEEFLSSWQAFMRAGWTSHIPQEEGVYPVRDREMRRGHDRTLKRVQGRLVDITRAGGYVSYGKVSEFRGDWWGLPYPRLPGAL